MNLLTLIIFVPLLAGLIILLMPSKWRVVFRYVTLLTTLVQFAVSLFIYCEFKTGPGYGGVNHEQQFQFVQKLHWINLDLGPIGKMQIDYVVGIDGLSIAFLGDKKQSERLFCFVPDTGYGRGRGILRAGLLPLLYIL
jgi:NADH-quinone oxidoreductase subunit M